MAGWESLWTIIALAPGVALAAHPRRAAAGAAAWAPTATPAEALTVLQDFKAELLYSVPKDKQGSWINMTVDPKGRLIVFRPIWPALSDHATSDQQIRW